MSFFSALFRIDLRRYWYCVLLFAAMSVGMPILMAQRDQSKSDTPFQMLLAFSVVVCGTLTPFWFIGMDRVRGSMVILWRLPVARATIVASKLAAALLVNTLTLLACGFIVQSTDAISMVELARLLEFGLPMLWMISIVSVPIYFLVNPQIAPIVAIPCVGLTIALFLNLDKALLKVSIPMAVGVAFVCAITAAVICVRATTSVLAVRLDPR